MTTGRILIDELVEYFKKNFRKGYTIESLRWALIDQGYSRMEVDRAIKKVNKELADRAPILRTKPEIKHEVVESKEFEAKKPRWKRWF